MASQKAEASVTMILLCCQSAELRAPGSKGEPQDKTNKAYMRRIIKADENRNERYAKTCKVGWNRDDTTKVLKYLTKLITIIA